MTTIPLAIPVRAKLVVLQGQVVPRIQAVQEDWIVQEAMIVHHPPTAQPNLIAQMDLLARSAIPVQMEQIAPRAMDVQTVQRVQTMILLVLLTMVPAPMVPTVQTVRIAQREAAVLMALIVPPILTALRDLGIIITDAQIRAIVLKAAVARMETLDAQTRLVAQVDSFVPTGLAVQEVPYVLRDPTVQMVVNAPMEQIVPMALTVQTVQTAQREATAHQVPNAQEVPTVQQEQIVRKDRHVHPKVMLTAARGVTVQPVQTALENPAHLFVAEFGVAEVALI